MYKTSKNNIYQGTIYCTYCQHCTLLISDRFNPFTPEVDIYARSCHRYCAKADQYEINKFIELAFKNFYSINCGTHFEKRSWFLDNYAN